MHFSAAPVTPVNQAVTQRPERLFHTVRNKASGLLTNRSGPTESKSGKIISHFLWSFLKSAYHDALIPAISIRAKENTVRWQQATEFKPNFKNGKVNNKPVRYWFTGFKGRRTGEGEACLPLSSSPCILLPPARMAWCIPGHML